MENDTFYELFYRSTGTGSILCVKCSQLPFLVKFCSPRIPQDDYVVFIKQLLLTSY